jgi:hypothetical protein
MEDNTLVESSCSATINAPIEKVDIPGWCFTLPEAEYQSCSATHCTAGATTSPDGRRMSINVEILGGSPVVQHYIEEIGQPDHLRLVSNSDVFTPTGRTKIGVIWDLVVRKIDDKTCEFTNTVQSCATPGIVRLPRPPGDTAGRLPECPKADLSGPQPTGDADVRKEHRT